ncbi:MAG: nuclear transport factor 2 family protein [Ignavibacteriales bacterium]
MKKLCLILFAVLFISVLGNAQDMSDLKNKVQMMNDESAKKWVAGDMESLWGSYDENIISMPSYEPMMKGIEACKESYKKMNDAGMKVTAFKSTVTDVMQAGNLVVDIGTYEISMIIPQMGDQPWNDHGKYMTIWEMQDDGSLKIKVETWNTDVNPWMEMQKSQGQMESKDEHKH